jgi:DNA-binding HxlR family transcriptional regulator
MAKEYNLPCPVAKSLDVVGDRWTLLIVRDLIMIGPRKYVDLERSLEGIAPNILSDRLKLLEENGVIDREPYEEHPPRYRYKLTRMGVELRPVLQALSQWGNKFLYDDIGMVHRPCGHALKVIAFCEDCDREVPGREVGLNFRPTPVQVTGE